MKYKLNVEQPYFNQLARLMARDGKDCWQASVELDLGITPEECNKLMLNSAFQTILRTERLKYYNELATDPNRSKDSLIGQMYFCIDRLVADGSNDKAVEACLKAAKVLGLVGADTNITFGNFSSKELDDMKAKIRMQRDKDKDEAIN